MQAQRFRLYGSESETRLVLLNVNIKISVLGEVTMPSCFMGADVSEGSVTFMYYLVQCDITVDSKVYIYRFLLQK